MYNSRVTERFISNHTVTREKTTLHISLLFSLKVDKCKQPMETDRKHREVICFKAIKIREIDIWVFFVSKILLVSVNFFSHLLAEFGSLPLNSSIGVSKRICYRFPCHSTDLEIDMEKEEKNKRACMGPEADLFLQWGNRKRVRCVRMKDPGISDQSSGGRIRRKITSLFVTASEKETFPLQTIRLARNCSVATTLRSENRKSSSASPDKEDRLYTTRGSVVGLDENGKVSADDGGDGENRGLVWPKLYISLSSKEKEEDFMAMKGCKLPQRPKKRAKIIQRSLVLVSPGAWLSDMCQERYEVREKKSCKRRPRGLKAMRSVESDSD